MILETVSVYYEILKGTHIVNLSFLDIDLSTSLILMDSAIIHIDAISMAFSILYSKGSLVKILILLPLISKQCRS